jgi:hypothetical protein
VAAGAGGAFTSGSIVSLPCRQGGVLILGTHSTFVIVLQNQ